MGPLVLGILLGSFIAKRFQIFGFNCRFRLTDLLIHFLYEAIRRLEPGKKLSPPEFEFQKFGFQLLLQLLVVGVSHLDHSLLWEVAQL